MAENRQLSRDDILAYLERSLAVIEARLAQEDPNSPSAEFLRGQQGAMRGVQAWVRATGLTMEDWLDYQPEKGWGQARGEPSGIKGNWYHVNFDPEAAMILSDMQIVLAHQLRQEVTREDVIQHALKAFQFLLKHHKDSAVRIRDGWKIEKFKLEELL